MTEIQAGLTSWKYAGTDDNRDLRIDMIRGLVMLSLVVVHIEFFSVYNFFVWERIGIVTGAEGFVLLSGIVVGMLYKRAIAEHGWNWSVWKLLDRAAILWRVNVAAIFLIALLNRIPYVNVHEIMGFNDRGANKVYSLFPAPGTPYHIWVVQALLLRIGPHQLQILGLYICLMALSPLSLYLLSAKRTPLLLALSWIVYLVSWASPSMPTGAQFEYGFPLLTWQLLFFHGQALGYHRQAVWEFLTSSKGRPVLVLAGAFFLAFLFWAQNVPNPVVPSFSRMSVISPSFFNQIYGQYMLKNTLGPLRVLNDACVLIVSYAFLTLCWRPVNRIFGWFFIPLGQASLYVFIVHIAFVALVSDVLPFGFPLDHPRFWLNTLGHTLTLVSLWLMVRYKVLFRWIPR
jgi:hypothetical protein